MAIIGRGKPEQGSGRSFRLVPKPETEGSGLCDGAGAPGEVTEGQLKELNIAVTAQEEE